jgi:hypothetical protein
MCRSTSNFSDDKFHQTGAGNGFILYQLREVQDEATDICDYLQRVFEVTWDSCESTYDIYHLFEFLNTCSIIFLCSLYTGGQLLRNTRKKPQLSLKTV